MINIGEAIMVIVIMILGVFLIDFLIKRFFETLEGYQDRREKKAVNEIKELFNEIPKVMVDLMTSITDLEEQKYKKKEEEKKKQVEVEVEDLLPY